MFSQCRKRWLIHTCLPTGPGVDSSVNDITASAVASTLSMGIQAITWDSVQMATASDPDMNQLVTAIKSGMPEKRLDFPPPLREFHKFRHDLHTIDGVVLFKDRIVIPPSLRSTVLSALHSAHQGVTSMLSRAEASVFWPGLTADISSVREVCYQCNRMAPSQPAAPPFPVESPSYPFQCVCADFSQHRGTIT